MPLKQKGLFLIVILNTISFFTVFFIVRYLLVTKFDVLEKEYAYRDVKRVELALQQRVDTTAVLVKDWSIWDDAYMFVQDKNPKFIADNVVDSVFNNVNVHVIAFFDTKKTLAFGRYFDFDTQTQKEIPTSLVDTLAALPSIESSMSATGFVDSQYGIMYFSSHPIIQSNGSGPVMGNLVMAKIIDKLDVALIEKTTNLNFDLYTSNLNGTNFNDMIIKYDLTKTDHIELDERNFHVSHLINDIYGKPALIVNLTESRDINNQGAEVLNYLFITYIICTALSIFVALMFADTMLVKPFSDMLDDVKKIALSQDFSARLKIYKDKEFKELSTSINKMLEALNTAEQKLVSANDDMQKKALELESKTTELERLNGHFVGREIRMAQLKKEIHELKEKLGYSTKDSSDAS